MHSYSSESRSQDKSPSEPWPSAVIKEEHADEPASSQAPMSPAASTTILQTALSCPSGKEPDNAFQQKDRLSSCADQGEAAKEKEKGEDKEKEKEKDKDKEMIASSEEEELDDPWRARANFEAARDMMLKNDMNNYPEGHWWEWNHLFDRFVTWHHTKMWSIWFTSSSRTDFYWYVLFDAKHVLPY